MKAILVKVIPASIFLANLFLIGIFIDSAPLTARQSTFSNLDRSSPLKGRLRNDAIYKTQSNFHKIYKIYKDKVVYISTEKDVSAAPDPFLEDPFLRRFFAPRSGPRSGTRRLSGLGTGFIISSDGYICTNHHVVAEVDRVQVRIQDKEYPAKVIGTDQLTDVALLKVEGVNNLDPVYFGNSSRVQVGDWAIAIGNPFGLDRTFTVGVVSAVRKDIDELGNAYIQTDASINQGNSGGPLLNLDGEVIGINRLIISNSPSGGSLGIGFAIPINTVRDVLEQLKNNGRVQRGFIGVQLTPLSKVFAKELAVPQRKGALIGGVLSNSPAAKAGIKPRDVILQVDKVRVKNPRDLVIAVSRIPVGATRPFVIWRDKQRLNLFVTVGERPTGR